MPANCLTDTGKVWTGSIGQGNPPCTGGHGAVRRLAVVVIAAIVGVVALTSCGGQEEDEGDASPAAEGSEAPASTADVSISYVRESSYCQHDVVVGNVDFVVYLRNDGADPVDVDVLPIRHYTDGTTNQSLLDEMTATIPPDGRPHLVWHSYEIEPTHTLTSCEAEITSPAGEETVDVPVPPEPAASPPPAETVAPEFDADFGFQIPSGNIVCNWQAEEGAISCVVFSASSDLGQKTWTLPAGGAASVDVVQSNIGTDVPIFPYGET